MAATPLVAERSLNIQQLYCTKSKFVWSADVSKETSALSMWFILSFALLIGSSPCQFLIYFYGWFSAWTIHLCRVMSPLLYPHQPTSDIARVLAMQWTEHRDAQHRPAGQMWPIWGLKVAHKRYAGCSCAFQSESLSAAIVNLQYDAVRSMCSFNNHT